jgi:hypothetical protein
MQARFAASRQESVGTISRDNGTQNEQAHSPFRSPATQRFHPLRKHQLSKWPSDTRGQAQDCAWSQQRDGEEPGIAPSAKRIARSPFLPETGNKKHPVYPVHPVQKNSSEWDDNYMKKLLGQDLRDQPDCFDRAGRPDGARHTQSPAAKKTR